MLACRPMLCFALSVMAGAVLARRHPELSAWTWCGWLLFAMLSIWFILTPRRIQHPEIKLPVGYGEYILTSPGFFARRGLNRFMIISSLAVLLLVFPRYDAWRARLDTDRLPEKRWYDATLLTLGPCREHEGEDGRWRIAARLLAADGRDMGSFPVRLSGPEGADFRRGDIIQCRVRR